jgi:hypothetical protein
MRAMGLNRFLNYFIALVWVINGFLCKVLDLVPRHRAIVARILGDDHAVMLTKLIGLSEIAMAVWVLSGIARRLNACTQILIIAAMNILEFFLAPDLLLWGRSNAVVALLFIILIYYNKFEFSDHGRPA